MTVVDRRILILQELESLLSGLDIELSTGKVKPGNFIRNRNELVADKRPGIILLDGDETPAPSAPMSSGRNTSISTRLMVMRPEIYVVLETRKPQNINVGEDLSLARGVLIRAIAKDAILSQICGSNGQISYEGCVTDLARNRTMEGQMGVAFSFVYPFIPMEIAG